MDSKYAPVRVKSGGTQISRRTVARGAAWTAPIAVMAYAAPAFAASAPPVLATQCGDACKHPGNGGNDKTYHFTFCFTSGSTAIDNNQVTLGLLDIGSEAHQAFAGANNTVITVPANTTQCYWIDAPGFSANPTTGVTLAFSYSIGGVVTQGCAQAQVTGDTCQGAKHPLDPDSWPHASGPVTAAQQCTPTASTAC